MKNDLVYKYNQNFNFSIRFLANEVLPEKGGERWFSPIDRTLRRELKSNFGNTLFWFNTTSYKELVDVRIKYQDGYFKFLIPRDSLTRSSARIFGLWITVPALIVIIISLIFLTILSTS